MSSPPSSSAHLTDVQCGRQEANQDTQRVPAAIIGFKTPPLGSRAPYGLKAAPSTTRDVNCYVLSASVMNRDGLW